MAQLEADVHPANTLQTRARVIPLSADLESAGPQEVTALGQTAPNL